MKKANGKTKKDISKWCYFHKIPWNNIDECLTKQSLVVKMKALELDLDSNFDLELEKGKKIIKVEPSATLATT